MKRAHPFYIIGRFFYWKYRTIAIVRGLAYAKQRLKKDGAWQLHDEIFSPKGHEPEPKPKPAPLLGWRAQLVSYFMRKAPPCDTSPP